MIFMCVYACMTVCMNDIYIYRERALEFALISPRAVGAGGCSPLKATPGRGPPQAEKKK